MHWAVFVFEGLPNRRMPRKLEPFYLNPFVTMTFYIRSEDVPELAGLSKWERRAMLRGTFLKERSISTLVLLGIVLGSVNYLLNPLIQAYAPDVRNNSMLYMVILLGWLFLLMWARDVVMMNLLRPKIAAKRAELAAKQAADADAAA